MKHVLAFLFLLAPGTLLAGEFTLASDGASAYVIITADAPTAVEATAAAELQTFLEQISGVKIPICTESAAARESESENAGTSAKALFIGKSQASARCFPDVDFEAFRYDEILYRTDAAGNVLFAGHAQRGTLYAVYTFLEDVLGCRWWTSTESTIPAQNPLRIGKLDHRYASELIYREAYYRDAFPCGFAARNKCNGNMARIPAEFGGHHRFMFFVHSFYPLIPPTKYFREHPEWFPEIDGVRKVGIPGWAGRSPEMQQFLDSLDPAQVHERGTQLCLTNDAMREELTRNALEKLRANPDVKFISISQNDWAGYCTCPKCSAIDAANESPAGSLITFVNRVAEDIEKEFPDVWVETLAYQYTRKPPKLVRPRHNVVVRLCTIECSFLQPLESGPLNASLKSDIEGWSAIAPQLFVWNYITNFSNYLLPHPNLRVLAPDVRFFVKNKTIGLFEQGDSFTTCGDFVAARAWVVAHLMWNPDADEKALWDEFFRGYYGPAGPVLQRYLDVIHDHAEGTEYNLRCYLQSTNGWLDPETLNRSLPIADEALAAVAEDPVLTQRVKRALVAGRVNLLMRYDDVKLWATLAGEQFHGPADPAQLARETFDFIKADGTTHFAEGRDIAPFRDPILARFSESARTAALPEVEGVDFAATRWLDFQEGQLRLAGMDKDWAAVVDDPAASNGRAVRMPGWHYEWATARSFPPGIETDGRRWHVYASVRCELAPGVDSGRVMTLGIYDSEARKSVTGRTLNAPQTCSSEYTLLDLGVHALTPEMYIWFAPPKRPDEVAAVFVDRVILIEER